jgi:predicted MPP superfamily phosphohydrolase
MIPTAFLIRITPPCAANRLWMNSFSAAFLSSSRVKIVVAERTKSIRFETTADMNSLSVVTGNGRLYYNLTTPHLYSHSDPYDMSRPDFSKRAYFPGTYGNPLDVFLRVTDFVETFSAPIFAGLLVLIAILPTRAQWPWTIGLWLFMVGDWALLAALSRAEKSFGPAKPSTLALAILRALFALLPLAFALPLQMIGTGLVIYGFWIEPHRITVTHQVLRSPKLKPGAPLRILHLGDLHVERITGRERKLLELIPALKPDLILFSGDFLNLSYIHDPVAQAQAREVLGQWSAPLGVYAVSGSPAVDVRGLVPSPLLDGLPIRWLGDEKITIQHQGQEFDLVGLTCTHKPFVDGPRLRSALGGRPSRFTLLLYHTPDLAPDAAEAGVDLQLSGHTHGGQVRLPFYGALITGSLYGKRFEVGRRQVEGLTLYVTRGLGMEGKGAPRVRFLCPPEITLWELSGT